MHDPIGKILNSDNFIIYSKFIGCAIAGGTFILFLMKNQIDFYKDQNSDLEKKYELVEKTELKNCENEKSQLKLNIETSILLQYKKFSKDSKESKLYLETINLINENNSK